MAFPKNFCGAATSALRRSKVPDEDGKSPTEADYLLGADKNSMRVACYRMPDGTEGKVPVMSGMLPKGAKYILKDGVFTPTTRQRISTITTRRTSPCWVRWASGR